MKTTHSPRANPRIERQALMPAERLARLDAEDAKTIAAGPFPELQTPHDDTTDPNPNRKNPK